MTITTRKARSKARIVGLKAVGDPADGIFEAYVSIFGNVDYGGDRIKAGAFANSLARWKSSGDPIPTIFSHQWDSLDSHIGEVLEAEEHMPGDARLPDEIKELGGLWTKFALEMDEPFAARVAKKLTKRTIKEFSFAYDVVKEERAPDGVNELLELDVLEVGPTLLGMNPATVLLSKALGEGWEDLSEEQVLERLAKAVTDHAAKDEKARVSVTFEGAVEAEIEELYSAGFEWAKDLDVGDGGFYCLHQEATYPAELRSIVLVEGWNDPWGEGVFYELSFERGDDGELTLKEAAEIEVAVEVSRKARAMKHRGQRSAPAEKARGTVPSEPKTGKSEGQGQGGDVEPEGSEGEVGSEDDDEIDPDLAELDLIEAALS